MTENTLCEKCTGLTVENGVCRNCGFSTNDTPVVEANDTPVVEASNITPEEVVSIPEEVVETPVVEANS